MLTETETVYVGMRTHWGKAQTARMLAPGIGEVSTASHGGIKLSPERLAQMPPAARSTPYSPGCWFEEDSDMLLVLLRFADELLGSYDDGLTLEKLEGWVRDQNPKAYEAITGKHATICNSRQLAEDDFNRRHVDSWLGISACAEWANNAPTGYTKVTATLGCKRAAGVIERTYLVPTNEYHEWNTRFPFVIDMDRHKQIA